jgi:hypothetical protein
MLTTKSLLAAFAAGSLCTLGAFAQETGSTGLQWTNLGEFRAPTNGEHVLTDRSAAVYNLEQMRAELAPYAFQEPVDFAGSSGPERTNNGQLRAWQFQGHKLTKGAEGAPYKILYAPSEADDVGYRNAMAAAAGGGSTCDYFDARAATPSIATLAQYDVVLVWANFAFSNNILFGDNLAAYNDGGGSVVLGAFCAYTSGNFLSGKIMTAGYCPVKGGFNHFSTATYNGDGTTCIYNGVSSLDAFYRDILVLQGSGVIDGTFSDGEMAHAYRGTNPSGAGDVVYSNGNGGFPVLGGGQWANIAANLCSCSPAVTFAKILYAPSEADDAAYRAAISAAGGGAIVDYFDASAGTPSAALLATYDCVHVWANFAFADSVGYGNNLAVFVDNGGDVVMGAFCTYTSGNSLSGQIMTPGYCPVVSPSGTNHFSSDVDTGPWFTCLASGVTSIDAFYRDVLVLQGNGIRDGRYNGDKEISTAYRRYPGGGGGDVVYANGSGGFPVTGGGQWPAVVANACTCNVGQQGPAATCVQRFGVLGLNPADCKCGNNPIVGQVWNVQVSTTPSVGSTTLSTYATIGLGGPTSGISALGYEVLILPTYIITTAFGSHNIAVPPTADFIGASFTLQGGRLESGPSAIVFTNALDITVGL